MAFNHLEHHSIVTAPLRVSDQGQIGCTLVNDMPDNCNTVKRVKDKAGSDFADFPNILYEENDGCAVHWLHNFIVQSLGEKNVCGHVRAVQTVLSVHGRRTQLQAACIGPPGSATNQVILENQA